MRTSRGGRAVLLVATLASVVWLARPAAAAPPPNSSQLAGASPGVLVLVRQLTWDQAAAAASGHGEALSAGLVSTLPADASLPDRVLSLAAGRPVDAGALEGAVAAQSDGGVAAADRMRAANPDASFGALAPTRVLASPGMTAAGLLAIGNAGAAPPADPLPAAGPLETVSRELLVIAVPDAAGLQGVLARVRAPGGARARVLVVGLESPPGRARTAPLLELGGRATAVVTSDSTRHTGLVAFQDVRPTLTGSAVGTQGAPIRLVPRSDPLGFVGHLDRQVGALVSARTLAVVVYAVVGTFALAVCLAALLSARSTGWAAALAGPMRPLARALVLASLAMPSGYLIASAVAPTSWLAWLLLGLVASAILTLAAWRLSSTPVFERPAPAAAARRGSARATGAPAARGTTSETGWAAPALLGGLLTGLVVIDLLAGGGALSRPLLGNSAFDGERFYGLGNGYFAHALAGIFLVVAFRRLRAWVVAALLAGLAVVDGLPSLGADVGGALTAMLSAAAALLLLGRARPSPARIIWLAGAAVVAAGLVVVGVALVLGETTHGSRVAQDLGSDPGAALRAVGHQLSGNFGLLAANFWAWWGPLLVAFAGFASLRPPALLAGVPDWVLRAVGVGAIGSTLLILLNDTGVTAAAGSGLALVVTLAWSALEPARAPDPAGSRSAA